MFNLDTSYNYVFFDDAKTDYYQIARSDLYKVSNCIMRNRYLTSGSNLTKFLFRLHTSLKLNRYIKIPFQSIWNKKYIGTIPFQDDKPLCFVFSGEFSFLFNLKTFEFLRNRYPNCKLVFHLRDFLRIIQRSTIRLDLKKVKQTFDLVYSTNEIEANHFGLKVIHAFCSMYEVVPDSNRAEVDVVFIGGNKGRIQEIVNAYIILTRAGLSCDFLVINSTIIDGIPKGISQSTKWISYKEMLERTCKAKCILEITQNGTTAMTSRFLEALCYNKKLITNNVSILRNKYYNSDYIQIIQNTLEIQPDFVAKPVGLVDYKYQNDYSPINFLKKIDNDLREYYVR